MCGIAGMWRFHGEPVDPDRLSGMAKKLAHRGPDGEGIWFDGSVGFAHRRLAIVDLSESGAQPMKNADGSLVVTFNGEIYNYQELRAELEGAGVRFRSTSDTEVLLHLYEREGEKMLAKLRGMFAFAMWDAKRERLFFARDRMGKKPFFYRHDARGFSFASELKALSVGERLEVDFSSVRAFLGLQYVPSPQTGFVGVESLPPAHAGFVENGNVRVWRYDAFEREPKLSLSFEDAAKEARRLFEESVRLRLIADVPVGAFLSGGVDSSAVVAMMSRLTGKSVPTFTMGFPSFGADERTEARAWAKQLGTDHHEFEANPLLAAGMIDDLVELYDAPYADSSALPTWLLAKETHGFVKAVMTGDGGDELFGGYRRYQHYLQALRFKRWHVDGWVTSLGLFLGSQFHDPRVIRFARMTHALRTSHAAGYASLFTGSYFSKQDEPALLQPDFLAQTDMASGERFVQTQFVESLGAEGMLAFDLASYLPDDLNVKMDRASMAHGLEARSPFLDQDLVRFAARLPLPFLLKYGRKKELLRSAFRDLVSEEVFDRPKRGFQVPLADWFRGPLKSVYEERCLSDASPLRHLCRPEALAWYLAQNDLGSDHGNRLWMLTVLATWLQKHF